MSEERSRRLSQIFDPLARFTDHSGAGQSASTPNSPRLLPRRSRDPPPPPPRPLLHPAAAARLDPLELELAAELGGPGLVNWQERCLELQLELHRSRHQATRVRDMLRDKHSFNILIRHFRPVNSPPAVHRREDLEAAPLTNWRARRPAGRGVTLTVCSTELTKEKAVKMRCLFEKWPLFIHLAHAPCGDGPARPARWTRTETENGTGVENGCGVGITIKRVTGCGIESDTDIQSEINRHKDKGIRHTSMLAQLRALVVRAGTTKKAVVARWLSALLSKKEVVGSILTMSESTMSFQVNTHHTLIDFGGHFKPAASNLYRADDDVRPAAGRGLRGGAERGARGGERGTAAASGNGLSNLLRPVEGLEAVTRSLRTQPSGIRYGLAAVKVGARMVLRGPSAPLCHAQLIARLRSQNPTKFLPRNCLNLLKIYAIMKLNFFIFHMSDLCFSTNKILLPKENLNLIASSSAAASARAVPCANLNTVIHHEL
ncbi:hypothetical protein EVAR_54017_1 [Eumeta japonica]|uniref:Uncharacterized protein n=1 Tax=Eumeta variegata TaxID=151549 RepID=A0A4C1XU05_EUMVA|nr:hypothetical protein EVAR_54017_1 [Eumeta japonica]